MNYPTSNEPTSTPAEVSVPYLKCAMILLAILAAVWLNMLIENSVPLPIHDGWVSSSGMNDNSFCEYLQALWGSQNEQRAPIGGIVNSLFRLCHISSWYLPFFGYFITVVCCIYSLFQIKHITNNQFSIISISIPLLFFHSSFAYSLFRPDMQPFAVFYSLTVVIMILLLQPAQETRGAKDKLIAICLILISTTTTAGVVFAAFLGAAFFFRAINSWKTENISPLPAIIGNLIAAFFCLLYFFTMNIPTKHILASESASAASKLRCFFNAIACTWGELGLSMGKTLGLITFVFLIYTIYRLFILWRNKNISGNLILICLLIFCGCMVNPLLIGYWRGGWSGVGIRHIYMLMPLCAAVALFWSIIETYEQSSKNTYVSWGILLLLCISFSFQDMYVWKDKKVDTYNNFMADSQKYPLEIMAAKYAPDLYPWPGLEGFMRNFRQLNMPPCSSLQDWKEMFGENYTDIPLKNITCDNCDMESGKAAFIPVEKGIQKKITASIFPRQYCKAIKIECRIKSPFPQENGKMFNLSLFNQYEKMSPKMNRVYATDDGELNSVWLWVDGNIDTFYIYPCDDCTFVIEKIRLYR